MMTRVRLLTLRVASIFTSKVEMHFMLEGTEFLTSLTLPRWLNMEFPYCTGDELEDLPPVLIPVKTEDFGCLSCFSL